MNAEENEAEKLPEGWILCQSKSSPGRRYFFNTKTGKSSWTQPQAEDESDQKKPKGKKEKIGIRDKRKKNDTLKKNMKRKNDGEEDVLSNKKQKPETTPEKESPPPAKPVTPAKCPDPKPVETEPVLKPILCKKNIANTRLSQLRARLSSEAHSSQLSREEVDRITKKFKATPRTPAPFEQKTVRFGLMSPPANEVRYPTRSPSSDSLHSASPSQFFAANKIISSIKAQLPKQFSNTRPKDTFADIEDGICNQTAEFPFMKHPTTPPQFSEASKLVSAIKSKLSYTPMEHREDKVRTYSSKEYTEKIKALMYKKDGTGYRNDLNRFNWNSDQTNHKKVETRALAPQKEFMGTRGNQLGAFGPNKEQTNCRNDKIQTSTPTFSRPTDPRQDKLRTFVSNIRHLNDIENNKQRTSFPNLEHINYSQYKARNCLLNKSQQTNQVAETQGTRIPSATPNHAIEDKLSTCVPNRQPVEDKMRTQISNRQPVEDKLRTQVQSRQPLEDPRRQIQNRLSNDNQRPQTPNRQPLEDPRIQLSSRLSNPNNLRAQIPCRQPDADKLRTAILNRQTLNDTRTPIQDRLSNEGPLRSQIPTKQPLEDSSRIQNRQPVENQLSSRIQNRQPLEDTVTRITNGPSIEDQTRIQIPKRPFEDLKTPISNRLCIGDKAQTPSRPPVESGLIEPVINRQNEGTLNGQFVGEKQTSLIPDRRESREEPTTSTIITENSQVPRLDTCNKEIVEVKQGAQPPNREHMEEKLTSREKIEDEIQKMDSIEQEIEKFDQKTIPQNQNIVNHRMEEVRSLEPSEEPNFTNSVPQDQILVTTEEATSIETSPETNCAEMRSPSPDSNHSDDTTSSESCRTPSKQSSDDSDSSIDENSRDSSAKADSDDEVPTYSSAKDRMENLRNRLSKEVELTEITDVEFLNSIKLPSPAVITDEEYLNMIELPSCSSEAMEVEEDLEKPPSMGCPMNLIDPNAEIVLVVDTNIFIHELDVIKNVLNSHIKGHTEQPTLLVPWRVVNELDRLKDNNYGNGAICKRARAAMDYLYKSLPENNRIKGQSLRDSNSHIYPCESSDDEILNCCLQQAERGKSVILLSNDKNLCNKATINGVRCIGLDELKPLLESKPQPSPDPDLCASVKRCEAAMYQLLANILENEMRAKYNNLWQHVVFKPPPWSLTDVLQCLLKHWIAVFHEVFPRIEHLITDLRNTVLCIENKDPESLTQSEVGNFKELCLEIAKKCQIIPEYMELAKATVERLLRKPSDEAIPEMVVIEAFERLWTVFSSYCAQLCAALGLACTLEDKLGGGTSARDLAAQWPLYSAQLYALTLAIKGAICQENEEPTEEQVDELEDVFKECLALVRADGSRVNTDNVRVFCTKCRNMLQEAADKFTGLTELLSVCKQRMDTM